MHSADPIPPSKIPRHAVLSVSHGGRKGLVRVVLSIGPTGPWPPAVEPTPRSRRRMSVHTQGVAGAAPWRTRRRLQPPSEFSRAWPRDLGRQARVRWTARLPTVAFWTMLPRCEGAVYPLCSSISCSGHGPGITRTTPWPCWGPGSLPTEVRVDRPGNCTIPKGWDAQAQKAIERGAMHAGHPTAISLVCNVGRRRMGS